MSSAKSKAISEIDLEEFERRLRVVRAPQAGVEDPLSELTRLVNTIAAERPQTEKVVDIASARILKSEPFPNAHQLQRGTQAPSLRDGAAPPPPAVAQPAPASVMPATRVAPPARVLKPAAAAAPATLPNRAAPTLRASFDETPVPAVETPDSGAEAIAAETHEEETSANEYLAQARQARERNFARPPRRGSWYLKVAGLTAVSVLMVGGAVAMKIGMPGLHKSPPLILAADGPSKLAPPNEATVQSAGDTSALLLKDSAAPTVDARFNRAPARRSSRADACAQASRGRRAAGTHSQFSRRRRAVGGRAQHAYRRALRGPGRRAGPRSHAVPVGQEGQNCFGPSGRDIDLVGYGP